PPSHPSERKSKAVQGPSNVHAPRRAGPRLLLARANSLLSCRASGATSGPRTSRHREGLFAHITEVMVNKRARRGLRGAEGADREGWGPSAGTETVAGRDRGMDCLGSRPRPFGASCRLV